MEPLLIWLGVGAFSGWLAGFIFKGKGFGLIGDVVIGVVGSLIAAWLFPKFGIRIGTGLVPYITAAAIGGIVLQVTLSLIRKLL
jgi:uncharacterized membrane protein YeaQ/YmgE (transglycosylase-associated protein family)